MWAQLGDIANKAHHVIAVASRFKNARAIFGPALGLPVVLVSSNGFLIKERELCVNRPRINVLQPQGLVRYLILVLPRINR
jgi:hypothetical protein